MMLRWSALRAAIACSGVERGERGLVGAEAPGADAEPAQVLDRIAEMGARNVHITMETGCFALVREERQVRLDRVLHAVAGLRAVAALHGLAVHDQQDHMDLAPQ